MAGAYGHPGCLDGIPNCPGEERTFQGKFYIVALQPKTSVVETVTSAGNGAFRIVPRPVAGSAVEVSWRSWVSESGSSPKLFDFISPGGRIERTLAPRPAGSGLWTVRWDRRDEAGRTLPAGVYFVRCREERRGAVGRIVIVR